MTKQAPLQTPLQMRLQQKGVATLISTRLGPNGESNFNLATHAGDQTHVLTNRAAIARELAVSRVQWLQQVHGCDVLYVDQVSDQLKTCDAVWTDQVGIGLAIMTADCVPVLVSDANGEVVGAAHAGWQGIEQKVVTALIRAMQVAAGDLHVVIGPSISQQNYEVGEDVWGRFPERFSLPHPDASKRYLDLAGMVVAELEELGIVNIERIATCVYDDDAYFSHRASQHQGRPEGRFVSAIGIKPTD